MKARFILCIVALVFFSFTSTAQTVGSKYCLLLNSALVTDAMSYSVVSAGTSVQVVSCTDHTKTYLLSSGTVSLSDNPKQGLISKTGALDADAKTLLSSSKGKTITITLTYTAGKSPITSSWVVFVNP